MIRVQEMSSHQGCRPRRRRGGPEAPGARVARPWLAVLAGLLILPGVARAQQQPTPEAPGTTLQKVGFDQNLDAQVPLDLPFRDEQGRPVRLGDYFGRRPVILTLVYYRCPMLCGLELNGLARSLKPLTPAIGRDFEVVTVSIDPTETPELAAEKKANYMKRYGRDGTEGGWHFLTGEAGSIARLAQAVGFRYTYNPQTKLYAHAAGLVILTPGGRIARYFYGIDFPAKDVQGALAEAQAGKVGAPIARLLLFCYD
ncbi:MAG TPA: SCO family protein, partial [Isosphaeraceae bacterium]